MNDLKDLSRADNRAITARVVRTQLAPRVKALLRNRGSIRKLGLAIGYDSESSIFALFRDGDPQLSVLLALAAVLDVDSLDELFGPPPVRAPIEEMRVAAQATSAPRAQGGEGL